MFQFFWLSPFSRKTSWCFSFFFAIIISAVVVYLILMVISWWLFDFSFNFSGSELSATFRDVFSSSLWQPCLIIRWGRWRMKMVMLWRYIIVINRIHTMNGDGQFSGRGHWSIRRIFAATCCCSVHCNSFVVLGANKHINQNHVVHGTRHYLLFLQIFSPEKKGWNALTNMGIIFEVVLFHLFVLFGVCWRCCCCFNVNRLCKNGSFTLFPSPLVIFTLVTWKCCVFPLNLFGE